MLLDIDDLKKQFMESIRTYVYPQQTVHTDTISLLGEGTIDQKFYPFSTTIDNCLLYIDSTIGAPGYVTLDVLSRGSTVKRSSISPTTGWNTFSIGKEDIVSRNIHTLRIYGGVSAGNDCYIGIGNNSSYFYGTLSCDSITAFSIGINNHVEKIYPSIGEVNLDSLPLIVVDITSRPRVRERYITGDMVIQNLNLRIEVYGRYTDEVDKLCYGIERGLFLNRKTFYDSDITLLTPSVMGPLSFISPEIFFRDINLDIEAYISRE